MRSYSRIFVALSWMIILSVLSSSCGRSREAGRDEEGNLYGTISISGAFAMYPLTVKWAEEFRLEHPKVRIDISAGGAGKGMADVLSGMVDLAMFSREVTMPELEKGAWPLAVAKDAVVPVFNSQNKLAAQIRSQGLTQEAFQQIFLGNEARSNWARFIPGSDYAMHIYTRSDACGAAETWAYYLGAYQENLAGTGIFGDPGIAEAVKNDPQGIGYNNICYVYDIHTGKPFPGLAVVPVDLDGDGAIGPEEDFYGSLEQITTAIAQGRYPSPPARQLYFISKGEPRNVVVQEFLNWVLQKGQNYVLLAGYVQLSPEVLQQEQQRIPKKADHE